MFPSGDVMLMYHSNCKNKNDYSASKVLSLFVKMPQSTAASFLFVCFLSLFLFFIE